MPSFEVTTPDGAKYRIDGAADEASALQAFQQQHGAASADTMVAPQIPNRGIAEGVVRGLRDPIDAGAQFLTHGLAAGAGAVGATGVQKFMQGQADKVDAINQQAETAYEKTRPTTGAKIARAVGNVAATLPLFELAPETVPTSLGGSLLRGAGEGAAISGLQPVTTPGNFWKQKGEQLLGGVVSGAPAAAGLNIAARAVAPALSPELKLLLSKGVNPTSGQRLGGSFNKIEEAFQNLPFVGDPITSARERALHTFNRASINEALAPIGERLSDKTPMGREAIKEAGDKIAAQYQSLVPQSGLVADKTFITNVNNLIDNAQVMNPQQRDQFMNIITNKVFRKFSQQNGGLTGESFKEAESDLGRLASDYRHSTDPDQRQLGGALLQMQAELRDQLARSNPAIADKLQAANEAYARYLRVQHAAAMRGAKEGVFTPSNLGSGVRALDNTIRKKAYAQGSAKMQTLADAGEKVLGNKLPDSGTTPRWLINGGGASMLAGLFNYSPETAAALGAGAGTAMGAYTRPGQFITNAVLSKRPAFATPIADTLRSLRLPRGFAAYSTLPNQ